MVCQSRRRGTDGNDDDSWAMNHNDDSRGVIGAGRVGRPHGLDGSFYVTAPRPRLLAMGMRVLLGERSLQIVRRAGTAERPIVRLEGIEDRAGAESVRGLALTVERSETPSLEENEWWANELEGCLVVDGERQVGVVRQLLELPSCEALEVVLEPPGTQPLLVPMVRHAIRHVDIAARTIDVDMSFVEGG
jgi:16S rRNA processing protein RimM